MSCNRLSYLLLYLSTVFGLSGCGLFENEQAVDTTGTIFGAWELEEISYENGETLTPGLNESYWFELKEDCILAEGKYHPSLEGQSYCNSCFGYFDYDEETQKIKIAFICNRLVCGIATEFASAGNDFNFNTIEIPTICKIITAIVRNNRFCDGALV